MKNVYLYTLGCKVNQYETEALAELFSDAGFGIVDDPAKAQVIIVNSCTVTANSDQKTRQAVRRFKRNNPSALVILCGCMPQAYPDNAAKLIEADIITGNKDHKLILDYALKKFDDADDAQVIDIPEHKKGDAFEEFEVENFKGRTRAFIKIQDGCDRFCSYCIIPTSRGRSRSRSLENLSVELDKIRDAGYKEVVLVGINFCCYGLDIGRTFVDPIELACQKGFERVRIGSLEYDNISDEAIERLSKLENFCPQFHMSLQSGCDKTLRDMNRHYTSEEYLALCNKLRSAFSDATITTDLMVGFAGETDEDFNQSLDFARRVGFEKIHVFPYSERPGTRALAIEPKVAPDVQNERTHRAIELANELRHDFLSKQVGRTVNVLCETYEDGFVSGYTENYTPVKFKSDTPLGNEIVSVTVTEVADDFVIGERV
ncbi:MAG: tRNA (N(6)-L-threonylcarbamoyladenosine(37)-C(2))-methylthiotransferase MtaB [Clostridia bacterium]|nr:tRNA (N(6)-L-threonylcarbamoyladenosine(37)-C(2))-methylthiotransferase MtaB [Clostridia bacterium]